MLSPFRAYPVVPKKELVIQWVFQVAKNTDIN
jgi:hypothetical protein